MTLPGSRPAGLHKAAQAPAVQSPSGEEGGREQEEK